MENTRLNQRHPASADDKTLEKWKLNYLWLIVVKTDSGVRLKCSVCSEAKFNSIWAEEGSGNIQKTGVTRHSQATEHSKAELLIMRQKYPESSSVCKTEDTDSDYKPTVNEEEEKFSYCLAKKLKPSDMINTFLHLQSLNGVDIQFKNPSWDSIKDIQSCISDTIQSSITEAVADSQY